jgi:hypothetical protein
MSKADTDTLVRSSQIKRWEREYASLGKQAQKIEDRRAAIKTMIDAAKVLMPRGTDAPAAAVRRRRSAAAKKRTDKTETARARNAAATSASASPPPTAPKRGRPETSEWKPIIREITLTSDRPVPYSEARQEIMKTPLGEKLQQSEKGFYSAIAKLHEAKEIVAYHGHLFSPGVFRKFKIDLDSGLVSDLKIQNKAHHSPMGEATKDIMRARPRGLLSGNIIWELRKNPEFARVIDKNKTHPYNVLATLIRKGDLVRRGKRYYSAELLENGTPPDSSSEGAPNESGEDGSSSSESRESGPTTLFG